MTNSGTTTAPHDYASLRFYDRFLLEGRCRRCLYPKYVHPVRAWVTARALGDARRYSTIEALARGIVSRGEVEELYNRGHGSP